MQLLVGMITKYQKRISGPLLDRIDIHIEVPRVECDKLSDQCLGEASGSIQLRVEAARKNQRQSFARKPNTERESQAGAAAISPAPTCNADMRQAEVRQFCNLDETGRALVRMAMNQLQMSARAYHRVLKLSRTIADLVGSAQIQPAHLAEALQYRSRGVEG